MITPSDRGVSPQEAGGTEIIPTEPDTVHTVVGSSEVSPKYRFDFIRSPTEVLPLFSKEIQFGYKRSFFMKTALTIAGSDSSAGAGIQADLKTFAAHGVYGMSVITAVTAQNTKKVVSIQEIRDEIVRDQIVCLFEDVEIHAVKIGMVSSVSLIKTIADALRQVSLPPVVLDPVMISKSGFRLLKEDAQDALIEYLFPLSEVVTPNLHEAQALVGEALTDIAAMKSAAKRINTFGVKTVVVKGGHLSGGEATDVFFDGTGFFELKGKRIATKNTHGTGCTFSSAIAANLALGKPVIDAVHIAKAYVTGAIEHALSIGKGCGPTHHFFDLYAKAGVDNGR